MREHDGPETTKGGLSDGFDERRFRPPLRVFAEGNLKGILSDYAPGAVLFTPDGPLRDAIRPFFETLIAEFGKADSTFRMKHQSVEGDHAYILWTAETADKVYELGEFKGRFRGVLHE